MSEPRRICKQCTFFNGEHCEFHFEGSISVDAQTKKESCITRIERWHKNTTFHTWTCCGGIQLQQDEKCSICGEGYDE